MIRRWLVSCGGAASAAVLLTSCASSHGLEPAASADPGTGSAVATTTTLGATTAAQNKSAAQAEADRLVSRAILPAGATRTTGRPDGLSGPAMGTPMTSQLIDDVAYYRVAKSLAETRTWFQANHQPGLKPSGTSSSGFEYDPSPPRHRTWGNANLEMGLVAQGKTTTAIRVDGLAFWINPTPTPDTARGPAIRVTVATGCPPTDRGRRDVSNPGDPDLERRLLPAAAPSAALRCTYAGLNGATYTLTSGRQLTATQAAGAAGHIQALPLGTSQTGPHGCPMDDARTSILAFSYPGRSDVDIWEHTSGCASTDNGHIVSGGY